jgi:hypothetical protein
MTVALQRLGPLSFHPGYEERPDMDEEMWLQQADLDPVVVVTKAHALVWRSQVQVSLPVALGPTRTQRVKDVRLLQMGDVQQQRVVAHQSYAKQALSSSGLSLEQRRLLVEAFCKSFAQVWKIPWNNRHKEVFWRLAVNGVAGAGGHDICHRQSCMCGYQLSQAQVEADRGDLHRQHAFWDCPVAMAVREELQRGLGVQVQLKQHHLWLLQNPAPAVQVPVWQVVGLAALEAMDRARRFMWWTSCQPGVSRGMALQQGVVRARSLLWLGLQDFTAEDHRQPPLNWRQVTDTHPFLSVQVVVPLQPRVVLNLPE